MTTRESLLLSADVLVIGGGPAGAWAALTAAELGRTVVLADKGFFGTSGSTAPANTGTWCLPPGEERRAAVERRAARDGGLSDSRTAMRVLGATYEGLQSLAARGYPFPLDETGAPYIANLRGPDYMRFMRRTALKAGVKVLDHHPALELLADGNGVGGAAGWDRQGRRPWRIQAGAVVLATGGCAFGERMLGATGLTGDGTLMAAEAGARLSGMEFSAQYGIAPIGTSLNKGLIYRWATFSDAYGQVLEKTERDRHPMVARALLRGPVFACLDHAPPQIQDWLRRGQPNIFLPFDRMGIDPFTQRFEITLRCEGTVRGVGGIRLVGDDGATDVPGLFAAGDTASREALTGAITGGGGPNASWAMASGQWAGRGAARFAGSAVRARRLEGRGEAGLRPRVSPSDATPAEMKAAVREEMLPLDRNFFRHETTLTRGLERLDQLWREARDHLAGSGDASLRSREAAGLLATARWSLASGLARRESRGMQRRLDYTASDPAFAARIIASGLDRVAVSLETIARQEAVS